MKIAKKASIALLAITAAVTLASCMSFSSYNRGSLSDAMDKARDDNRGSREVPAAPTPRPTPVAPPPIAIEGETGSGTDATRNAGKMSFGLRAGGNALSTISQDASMWIDGLVGIDIENAQCLVYGGFGAIKTSTGSSLDASILDGLGFARAGVEIRYLPFGDRGFFKPYVGGGIGGIITMWKYRNTIYSGGDAISDDSLNGFNAMACAGVYVARGKHVSVGITIRPEICIFADRTNAGFEDDYFSVSGTVSVGAEILFR